MGWSRKNSCEHLNATPQGPHRSTHAHNISFLPFPLPLGCTLLKTAKRRRISSSAAFKFVKSKTLKPLKTHVCECVRGCAGPCLETSDSYRVCARHSSFDTSLGKSDVSHDHKHRRNVSASFQDGTWLAKPEGKEKYYVSGEATTDDLEKWKKTPMSSKSEMQDKTLWRIWCADMHAGSDWTWRKCRKINAFRP